MPEFLTLNDKPYETHYLYMETDIDAPIGRVWPHALNIGSWMSAHDLVSVSGEAGEVGHFERVYPRNLRADVPPPHHHVYGIAHLVPYKYIALEVMPEAGGSYGKTHPWVSFDGILLVDLGAATRLIFLFVEIHIGKGEFGFHERHQKEVEAARDLLETYFENLKRLVAEGETR